MQEMNESFASVDRETLEHYRPFFELTEAWFAARCAARCAERGAPQDHGEALLAKTVVRDWLITEVAEGRADHLDATDLPFVWLNAHFPEELDANRMLTALVEWITWIGTAGLFSSEQTSQLIRDLEATRETFVRWARAQDLPSTSVEAERTIAAFTWWLREQKSRPFEALLAGQAALTAAINLMGDVEGDIATLDAKSWLERSAYVLIEDPHEPLVRDAVNDVIQWFGIRGEVALKQRRRLHRDVARAHQCLVRAAQIESWARVLAEAS